MTPESKAPEKNFYCTTEWHLAHFKSNVAAMIYGFACKIARESGKFSVSVESCAEYFDLDPRAVRKAYHELAERGWFVLVMSGDYAPNVYQPILKHEEWAKSHDGECCVKIEFPWTVDNDPFGQRLFAATGSKPQLKAHIKRHHLMALRKNMSKSGSTESEVVAIFKEWYPNQLHKPFHLMAQFIRHHRTVSTPSLMAT
jgi:hypothetical protein